PHFASFKSSSSERSYLFTSSRQRSNTNTSITSRNQTHQTDQPHKTLLQPPNSPPRHLNNTHRFNFLLDLLNISFLIMTPNITFIQTHSLNQKIHSIFNLFIPFRSGPIEFFGHDINDTWKSVESCSSVEE